MGFREATDVLFAKTGHDELAAALSVSVAAIRQARLRPDAAAHRSAPQGWEKAAAGLANARIVELQRLLQQIDLDERPHAEAGASGERPRARRLSNVTTA